MGDAMTAMTGIQIMLAGGPPLVRAGIASAIEAHPGMAIAAWVENARQASSRLAEVYCDIVLLVTDAPSADAPLVVYVRRRVHTSLSGRPRDRVVCTRRGLHRGPGQSDLAATTAS